MKPDKSVMLAPLVSNIVWAHIKSNVDMELILAAPLFKFGALTSATYFRKHEEKLLIKTVIGRNAPLEILLSTSLNRTNSV